MSDDTNQGTNDEAAVAAAAAAAEAASKAATPTDASIPDPEAKPAAPKADEKAPEVPTINTGDPALDVALTFFAKNGVTADNPNLKHAAASGDFSLLKAELAAKGATGWEQHVALAEQAATRAADAKKSAAAEAKAVILKAVGGEEAWKAVRDWAAANATPEERTNINAALAAGGFQAKAAAEYLATRYSKSGGAVKDPTPALKEGASSGKPTGTTLSPRAYAAAVEELANKVGAFRLDSHPEYKALQARRQAWKP